MLVFDFGDFGTAMEDSTSGADVSLDVSPFLVRLDVALDISPFLIRLDVYTTPQYTVQISRKRQREDLMKLDCWWWALFQGAAEPPPTLYCIAISC